jgi:MFS family permease
MSNAAVAQPPHSPQPPLWRNRDFLAVWSASTVSVFGSLITRTALPFAAILVLDAGAMEIAAIRSAEEIASLIVGLFVGAWVDRIRRRPIMIWADLGRAAILMSIPIAFVFGQLVIAHLLIVAFATAILTTFFNSADNAYLPTVVPRDRLVDANSALTASGSIAEFSSFGIGGFLIKIFSAPIAIAIDAVSFVVSAVLLMTIRKPEPPPNPRADREPVFREIRHGMQIVARSPVLRALALSHGGTHILWGVFSTGYFLFAIEELRLDTPTIGIIAALGGLGSLAGSAIAPRISRRLGIGPAILLGIVVFTIGNTLIPLAPAPTAAQAAAGMVLLGAAFLVIQQLVGDAGATVYEILEVSLVQASTEDRTLGRVNATIATFTTLLTLAGTIGGGIIAEIWGLRAAFAVGIVGAALSFLIVWFSPVRHIREAPIATNPVLPGDGAPLTE